MLEVMFRIDQYCQEGRMTNVGSSRSYLSSSLVKDADITFQSVKQAKTVDNSYNV